MKQIQEKTNFLPHRKRFSFSRPQRLNRFFKFRPTPVASNENDTEKFGFFAFTLFS